MKIVLAAVVMAIGIASAGFLIGGRYQIIESKSNAVSRIDRYTGEVVMCIPGAKDACGFVMEAQQQK